MADPNRGEIWLVDLALPPGHQPAEQRPVLIVSDDDFNAGLAGVVIVVPLTAQGPLSRNIPAHVRIAPPEGGVETPSVILCDQLLTISKDRLSQAARGTVSAATLAKVETALRMLLKL